MSFLQGYTAAAAGIAAMEATHARSLLAAQHHLLASQHAREQRLAALRQEIFAFANLFRQARESGRYLQEPAHGVFEVQRFVNWMALNGVSAASLSSFQDKAFLLATCEEADRVTLAGVQALGSRRAGAVQRLATLEDLRPYAAEYETWKGGRAALRRWTPLLFHGMSSLLAAFLLLVGALALSAIGADLTTPAAGLAVTATGLLAILAGLACAALALVGPLLRKALVAGLRRRVGVHGGWIGSRITVGRATDILAGIRARMALLDPALATPGRPWEIIEDERLAALRAEPARLRAVVVAG